MKFISAGDKENQAKLVRDILLTKLGNEVKELKDGYGISEEVLEEISYQLFVKHTKKVLWNGGKTKFVKVFEKEVSRLIKTGITSFEELGILTYLATEFTNHEDNYLKFENEYLTKKDLINLLHKQAIGNPNSSESYYKKKILLLEKKNLILSEPHPKDRRNKVFYLSPYLFYKGKYIDNKAKAALVKVFKEVHNEIKKLNKDKITNIPLDVEFETKDNDELVNQIIECLNQAS